MADTNFQVLDSIAEEALFSKKLEGLVAVCCENERPLYGLAGRLDWRFNGVFSHFLRSGSFTGKAGECVYLPVKRAGELYHIVLVGGGTSKSSGNRTTLPQKSITALKKNLQGLKILRMGISKQDFGEAEVSQIKEELNGVNLWLVN